MFRYILALLLFSSGICKAQNRKKTKRQDVSGIVVYSQQISVRVYSQRLDTLKFNRERSIFGWHLYKTPEEHNAEMEKKYPGIKNHGGALNSEQVNLLDLKKDTLYSRMHFIQLKSVYYLKEAIPAINWHISDSTKKVGKYVAKKATAHFRGRDYTAWFTPKIPVGFGPWKLHGLPGLILQAYDLSGNIRFNVKSISFTDVQNIGPITLNGNEKHINLSEYKKITRNFDKLMKKEVFKTARRLFPNKDLSELHGQMPDIQLMENFEK